ncbi:TspO and MBR related proteins [Pseudobutyrivibrio sp. OR37]|uniref:TspO/MBR family protein n=1 Tax=Pseudobutyrivibrio sp. OR37 TaxID=1798186 RepID=UPI0008E9E336|nr:TspO/MBR family protein [Pseudobutyrivibrio sp. OR37]SFH98811.1 TspO and MBR related proteins [Pseudobutyrivibrio sp. OR37]
MNEDLTLAQKMLRFIPLVALPLLVGAISAFITGSAMDSYGVMVQPPLAPPAWIFPIAWTILYILMGWGSYYLLHAHADTPHRKKAKFIAVIVYFVQLAFNFAWSLIFFNAAQYTLAFIWLMILWVMIIVMIWASSMVCKRAMLLFVPYLAWCTFAAYLNLMIAILN